jgi:predicted nucleic acid-binding protein
MKIVVDTNIIFSAMLNPLATIKPILWTRNKKLLSGLEKRNFTRLITTDEISNMKFTDL